MEKENKQQKTASLNTHANPTRRLSSSEIFGDDKQVLIEHGLAEYLLRITRQGKLILTK